MNDTYEFWLGTGVLNEYTKEEGLYIVDNLLNPYARYLKLLTPLHMDEILIAMRLYKEKKNHTSC